MRVPFRRPSRSYLARVGVAVAAALALAVSGLVSPASAASWAPAGSAAIHPGVQTFTNGAQCTANFIFSDGTNVYIGQAAHCSLTGSTVNADGCTSQSLPIGTQVQVTGASKPGVMVYNSWLTMQAIHETDANACAYNDLALVRLDPSDVGKVNPSIPFWGGPTGINTTGTTVGETVYSYGNSELRGGISQLSPKQGISLGTAGGGWTHTVYTVTPGIPGDSGSAFLDAQGRALGVLSTLTIAPEAGSNGVGDINHEINYMHQHSAFGSVQLMRGTEPFSGNLLGSLAG